MSSEPSISELVAGFRARAGLTQEGLARELGVSFSTVNAWEAGRTVPQPRHRRRLEQMAAQWGEGPPADERPTVLCIDDSPLDLELLVTLVRDAADVLGADLNVVAESDAVRGLIALGRLQPAVAFVDIVMPGLDGFELADRIAQMPDVHVGRLVLVTASRVRSTDEAAAERGLDILDKPLTLGGIGAVLRNAGVHATGNAN